MIDLHNGGLDAIGEADNLDVVILLFDLKMSMGRHIPSFERLATESLNLMCNYAIGVNQEKECVSVEFLLDYYERGKNNG